MVEVAVCSCFFVFKQKTAYEMRISDWSSDVCSSDLDGDPDLEECSDREQDDCDDPAWLERINQTGAPCPANMWWGYRDSEDEERDEAYYGLCLHYGVDQNAPASETNPALI